MGSKSRRDARIWNEKWKTLCHSLGLDVYLSQLKDPVPVLQVFLRRVRDGRLALQGHKVYARSAEEYLRAVGQTFTRLGRSDPRLNSVGQIDFRIQRQLKFYKKEDPPPSRLQPMPVEFLHRASAYLRRLDTPQSLAIVNLIWIAFFFLMRPGEFCDAGRDSHPFKMDDVTFHAGNTKLDNFRSSEAALRSATFATLTFTTQKSGVRGEKVGHGRSGTSLACAVTALADQVIRLRSQGATAKTPLCSYKPTPMSPFLTLRSKHFTDVLRVQALLHGGSYNITPSQVSVGAFRTTGAMALFNAGVDSTRIRLLGRWNSWAMLRYLHVQSNTQMASFAHRMLSGGSFTSLACNTPPEPENPENPEAPPVIVPDADPYT